MQKEIANCRRIHAKPTRLSWIVALLLAGCGIVLYAPPAFAQSEAAANAKSSSGSCQVFAVGGAQDELQELRAVCRGRGVILGPASTFVAIANDALQATLVDAHLGDSRRILMLSVQDDGEPLVEDLSGQVARAAGRGPMAELTGIDLDFKRFADEGLIGVRDAPGRAGAVRAGSISVGQQLVAERARQREGTTPR
jgi:hypothetical protein